MENLRVRLLGDLQIDGRDPADLGRRQVRTLFKILALRHGRAVGLDVLAECLWGERPPSRPTDQISVLVSRLRAFVGAERVRRTDAGYSLTLDWLDVDALHEYAEEAERRLETGAPAAAGAAAAAGLRLLRGGLLADEPDAWWIDTERSDLDLLVRRLQRTAAAAALATADWDTASEVSGRLLRTDPYDEVALRSLMEAAARSGRPASALAAYAEVRQRLAEDLGVSPSPTTEELHSAILLGDLPSPASMDTGEVALAQLPGRATALAELDLLFELARQGRTQVVVVAAEAGMGKSRLLQVWSEQVAARGSAVVLACCDEFGRALPLQPLLDVVSQLVRLAGQDGIDEVIGPEIGVLGPLLGSPTGMAAPAQLAVLTDPGAGEAILLAALFGVFRRQAERRPLVVVIDDAHVADAATIRWLRQARRRLADAPVMIVAAGRTEEGIPVPEATTVELGPLDLEAASAIVGAERAEDLLARSGGNPLFLVELAEADAENPLPANIRRVVEERCSRVGPAAATLRAAAVIGSAVDLDVLAAVTGTGPRELLDHLEEGVRRRFLVEDGSRFVFIHALVREALAATVGVARTTFIHREAARALGSRPDADPLVVARHARLGGERAQASAMLVAAARLAVLRFDHEGSLQLLDEAVALDDTVDVRLERARVYSVLAHYDLAEADLEDANSRGAGPESLEIAAWSAHFQRRFDAALDFADRGAEKATDADLRTNCLALGGWISLAAGDLAAAGERLEGALAVAPAGNQLAASWLGWLRTNEGRAADTLRLVEHHGATGLAAYRFPDAYALMAGTMALAMLGRPDDALTTLARLDEEVSRQGARRWVPRPLNLRGWILRNLGELAEADELNHAAIEAARPLGLSEPLANAFLDLASGRLLAGDLDAARTLLDEAARLADVEHAFRWRHELRGRLLGARLDLALGDAESALADAGSLAVDAARVGTPRYEIQARLASAVAAHRVGEPVDLDDCSGLLARLDDLAGLEAWQITAELAQEFGVDAWVTLARRRAGQLLARAGSFTGALERTISLRLA